MRTVMAMVLAATLAGCGVETVGTAATAAAGKKQEIEQGRRTADHAASRVSGAMDEARDRARQADK
jgi:hypothetical protein